MDLDYDGLESFEKDYPHPQTKLHCSTADSDRQ
jgi:hypothetical protein